MLNIVAIGGGDLGSGQTLLFDKTLVFLCQTERPRILFLPTASNDSPEYMEVFQVAYGRLGCETDCLRLWEIDTDPVEIEKRIRRADGIYVGGGNTKAMLERWRFLGVDLMLRAHADRGKPAGGLSAGAICWFRVGNSDWPQYEGIPGVNTAPIEGLGWIELAVCPHTRDEGFRLGEFKQMMQSIEGVGIGLDDCCAMQIRGGTYRFLASEPGAVAHRVSSRTYSVLQPHDDFRSLSELTDSPQ